MHHAATITRIRCLCLARSRETSVIGNPGYREMGRLPRLRSSDRTVGKWHGTNRCSHWSAKDVPVRPKSLRHESFHSRDLTRTNRLTAQATRGSGIAAKSRSSEEGSLSFQCAPKQWRVWTSLGQPQCPVLINWPW